ncbi:MULTISPECIES: TetR/AcrR family transcriptional regulator [unclassified Novosphingobium]|uniref:TetR/AcrR family transcriptional regulator n=1 Tax=Novosphingobium TaxID=165696 RepID=UPI00146E156E|nr:MULTISPECIES: WHG domain-containing protein [unclassified Novosphingobium]NMN06618.1 AcrR family transcriptional regulator [Novosphingobium sp. SG919]NMN88931.1 AcrR family transcriptional regulator [Novosphingobium sp. SG916]
MGRRSDHTREELHAMIVREGHRQLSEVGFARFSAREVAKQIGYSIGTIYNVMGSLDALMLAINGHTLDLWRAALEQRLEGQSENRLAQAIAAYFDFAAQHRNAWTALYDFRLPENETPPADYTARVTAITDVVVREVAAALPTGRRDQAQALARSLLATVHGHCFFAMNGTFRLLGETDPLAAALARVEDAVNAA